MVPKFWGRMAFLILFAQAMTQASAVAGDLVCPRVSAGDSILGLRDSCSASDSPGADRVSVGVMEGDEVALQRALNLVYRNRDEYIAILFHASWCPFSKICRPNFDILSSLFPSIRHFAFEETIIRPSILSRYGVHGFPTLFLLNSTMRVRYHGSRTTNSLVGFYSSVTGMQPAAMDPTSVEKVDPSNRSELDEGTEQENCPFSWAQSPEKLLKQDTYLALASSFVLLRILYFFLSKLNAFVERAWRRRIRFATVLCLWDYSQAYLQKAKQGFSSLIPRKRSNLHEGAMNAKAWASKSLVSVSIGEVSIGEPSSVRVQSVG